MALTAWDETYQFAHTAELAGTGIASVAVKRSTIPSQVWFRRSLDDGETWLDPVLVGTMAVNRYVQVLQKNRSRSSRLIVTDGVSVMWKSEDFGRNWSSF